MKTIVIVLWIAGAILSSIVLANAICGMMHDTIEKEMREDKWRKEMLETARKSGGCKG